MCSMSMVMDHGLSWPPQRFQDDQWRRDFEELLRKAKKYDEEHHEPDCELDEKRQALRKIAEQMGVEIAFP